MNTRQVDRLLRELHGFDRGQGGAGRDELRDELIARYGRDYVRGKMWTIMRRKGWFRPALAGLGLVVIGFVACVAPTRYDVEMGRKVSITFDNPTKSADLEVHAQEVAAYFRSNAAVEGVHIGISRTDGAPSVVQVTVWGQKLDSETLVAGLHARFPYLANASIAVTPLVGTATGNLVQAMGHGLLKIKVRGESADRIRAEILRQMAANGMNGDAQVEVSQGQDRRVRIAVHAVQDSTAQNRALHQ
jgi:hypothetical protein